MNKKDRMVVPGTENQIKKAARKRALLLDVAGSSACLNSENLQLILRFSPFLDDIKNLSPEDTQFEKKLQKILKKYHVPELFESIAHYIKAGGVTEKMLYNFSFQEYGANGQKAWAKYKVFGVPVNKEYEEFYAWLSNCLNTCEKPQKTQEKLPCFSYDYIPENKEICFTVSVTAEELVHQGVADLYAELTREIALKYFGKYKPLKNLARDLQLLDHYQEKRTEYKGKTEIDYATGETIKLSVMDSVYDLFESDDIDDENYQEMDRIEKKRYDNIRKIKERIRKVQEERFL